MWVSKQEWNRIRERLDSQDRRIQDLSEKIQSTAVHWRRKYLGSREWVQEWNAVEAINLILAHLKIDLCRSVAIPSKLEVKKVGK